MNNNSDFQNITRLRGFDSAGETFISNGRVFRGIYAGKGALYRQVLRICESHDLFQLGIVVTHELNSNPYPELPYDLLLEHERIPFISYPHEWSASMLKDAAIFHIDLYTELGKQGLTIKDWHPYNILFNGANPVFVDFSSIIPIENLQDEAYLMPTRVSLVSSRFWDKTSAYFFEMYWRMCEPYFVLPLYMMHIGKHAKARARMFVTTLNTANSAMCLSDVFTPGSAEWLYYKLKNILKKMVLIQHGSSKHWFLKLLKAEVNSLSVSLNASAYSNYYKAKGENFGFTPSPDWNNKQLVIDETIKRYQPKTLLDIGSNTGWYSILAAKLGCHVVALDIDEACVDLLYQRAKHERLWILPLVSNLTNLTPDVAPNTFENEPSLSFVGGDAPLLISADKRLKCDMVLALAIVHHLALGSGFSFEQIVKLLGSLTVKYLVVEFVAKDDELIVAEPTFFPSYGKNPQEYSWYTLENFLLQLRSVFFSIDIKPSNLNSRFIIICKKSI